MVKVCEFINSININIIGCANSGMLIGVVVDGDYVGELTREFISRQFGNYKVKSLDLEYEENEVKIMVTLAIVSD